MDFLNKIIDLIGGIPFLLITDNGKHRVNKIRIIEMVVGAVCTAGLLTAFAIPVLVREMQTKLEYMRIDGLEIKAIVEIIRQDQIRLHQRLERIDTIQQERLRREGVQK